MRDCRRVGGGRHDSLDSLDSHRIRHVQVPVLVRPYLPRIRLTKAKTESWQTTYFLFIFLMNVSCEYFLFISFMNISCSYFL